MKLKKIIIFLAISKKFQINKNKKILLIKFITLNIKIKKVKIYLDINKRFLIKIKKI